MNAQKPTSIYDRLNGVSVNRPRTIKDLEDYYDECVSKLEKNDPFLEKVLTSLNERKNQLEESIVSNGKDQTLRQLGQLENKCKLELRKGDILFQKINDLKVERVKTHKSVLLLQYDKLSGKKDIDIHELTDLSQACENELVPSDNLIEKVNQLKTKFLSQKKSEKTLVEATKKQSRRFVAEEYILKIAHEQAQEHNENPSSSFLKLFFVCTLIVFGFIMYHSLEIVNRVAPFFV